MFLAYQPVVARSFNVWLNSIGGLDSIGPVLTEQVTTTVSFFRINTLPTVSFALHSAIGHDVLMNLIKAFALPCEASGGLKLITLTPVNKHGNRFFPLSLRISETSTINIPDHYDHLSHIRNNAHKTIGSPVHKPGNGRLY